MPKLPRLDFLKNSLSLNVLPMQATQTMNITNATGGTMDIVNTAVAASQQSDRVLFIVSLIILGIFAVFVMRHFVRVQERELIDHKISREQHLAALERVMSDQHKIMGEQQEVLRENTVALVKCSEAMTRAATALEHTESWMRR